MDDRRRFGNAGEQLAAEFLQSQGLRVIERQYKKTFGEIDLICQDGDEVVFVEVKSRSTFAFGYPEDSVTPQKIRHILRVAQGYLLETKQAHLPWRIDVLAIEFQEAPPKITHIKNIDIPERFW
ncbi:YraN family protein [Patescibacteria group bacterium]|nr:MAG: YraN family protein [Patescibacteria group bacterium]